MRKKIETEIAEGREDNNILFSRQLSPKNRALALRYRACEGTASSFLYCRLGHRRTCREESDRRAVEVLVSLVVESDSRRREPCWERASTLDQLRCILSQE